MHHSSGIGLDCNADHVVLPRRALPLWSSSPCSLSLTFKWVMVLLVHPWLLLQSDRPVLSIYQPFHIHQSKTTEICRWRTQCSSFLEMFWNVDLAWRKGLPLFSYLGPNNGPLTMLKCVNVYYKMLYKAFFFMPQEEWKHARKRSWLRPS